MGPALAKATMHGLTRGLMHVAQGGKFGAGFASGFISSGFAVGKSTFESLKGAAVAARTAVMAVVGGVTSQFTGGKFANGAITGAFVHLFNSELRRKYITKDDLGLTKGYQIADEKRRLLSLPDAELLKELGFDLNTDRLTVLNIRQSLNESFNRYLLVSAAKGFPGSDGFYDFVPRTGGSFFDGVNYLFDVVGASENFGYEYYCRESQCGVLVYENN